MSFVRKIVSNLAEPVTVGNATLSGGTITETGALTGHSANARIAISRKTLGGGTPGFLTWAAAGSPPVDLVITSSQGTDVPNVDYIIIG